MAMTAIAAGSVAAPIIGGLLGQSAAAADRAAAMQRYQEALAQYDNVNIPDVQKQQLALQQLQQQGILTPDLEQAIRQGPTSMTGIQTDPRLAQAQMSALNTMSKMGQEGLTAQDLQALNASRRQVAGDSHAQQEQILESMQQRGMGGSGQELAARLAGSQAAADRASQQSDSLMSQAQQRMLQATSQAGALGGQMQAQQFGQEAQIASAKDQIANFNAQQEAAAQARNVAANNQAQAANLASKQNIANANVATSNAQQQYNKELLQQQFNNQMGLAGAKSNALTGNAQALNTQGNQIAQGYATMGAGASQGLSGIYTLLNKNKAAAPADPMTSYPGTSAYAGPDTAGTVG